MTKFEFVKQTALQYIAKKTNPDVYQRTESLFLPKQRNWMIEMSDGRRVVETVKLPQVNNGAGREREREKLGMKAPLRHTEAFT